MSSTGDQEQSGPEDRDGKDGRLNGARSLRQRPNRFDHRHQPHPFTHRDVLPKELLARLKLKEGDEIEVHVVGDRAFGIDRDRSRERALERIRAFRKKLASDWKFDCEEANAR